ncbi:OmpA family protein [Aliivibrio sp. S3MY1]|uniref:OmpA family protein n=1 Tax=unclassified Aliivibrio TaxID=2645654 RepID=UPI0023785ED7|nr:MULTISPECIES: OmpA family protein [unclassified Aliivibrio]MDD9194439.1 OmpA family protein [Aliivibrio sp. S3MY1]MDD9198222.1 OmpA family protein [Aliivibrio sp. S2MY1]
MNKHHLFVLSLGILALSGCSSFAEPGRGGEAENYPQAAFSPVMPDQPLGPEHGLRFDWELAARHLDILILEKAEWCFPATVHQAKQNEARIARELEGGLQLDAANDLVIQRNLLKRLERQLDYVKRQETCAPPSDSNNGNSDIELAQTIYDLLNRDNQFAFNSAELNPKYVVNLSEASQLLNKHQDFKLLVTGHADGMGEEDFNQDLALNRAKQVKRYLSIFGLSIDRIHVDSVGSNDPYLAGTEPHVRLTNRRVTIELLQLDQPLMLENNHSNGGN